MNLVTKRSVFRTLLVLGVVVCWASIATAQECSSILGWNVMNWEEDPAGGSVTLGLDGNLWSAVGDVTSIKSPLTSDFVTNEYTVYISGVTRDGDQVMTGSGTDFFGNDFEDFFSAFIDGGSFAVYEDPSMNATLSPFPPNADVPSTFSDGTLYLQGTISSMTTQIRVFTSGFRAGEEEGNFNATIAWVGGSHLGELAGQTEGFSFAGVERNSFIGIPAGFVHDLAGESFRCPVAVEESTWGQIKSIYSAPE